MRKTYYLLLLILLCTLNAYSAVICNQLVGGTKFELKSTTSAQTLDNIQTYGSDTFSASNYTLSSGSISIKGDQNKENVFVHTLSGLPKTNFVYTVVVRYSSNGETEFRFKKADYSQIAEIKGNNKSGTETFTIKSNNGSLSWSIQECGNQKADIVITSITVTGCIEQKLESEKDNVINKESIDRQVLYLETFKTPNTNATCKVEDLRRGVSTGYTYASNKGNIAEDQYAVVKNTDGTWGSWYKDNGAKIVYGNTQNNANITDAILTQYYQSGAKNTDYDGFLVANCNANKYVQGNPTASRKAIIFESVIYNICPNTYYDFSSFISNVGATAGHAEVNVLFEIIEIDDSGNEINPNQPLFIKETGYIACGDQSWKEFGGTFKTNNTTNIIVRLYNNNQKATPNANGKIIGNDVAIDDITISRLVPIINVYFDEALTSFAKNDVCNIQDTEVTLYVGNHYYAINDLLPGGYYIVEQREATANGSWSAWSPAMNAPKQLTNNSFEEVKVTVKANQGKTQYRAIVAPTAADVETVRGNNNAQLPGCSIYNITKEDSYANLKYQCDDITTQITENESLSIDIQYTDNKIIVTGIDTKTQISVINIIGKTIFEDITTENQYTIDLNPYHSGIYIVKIGNKVERIRKF